MFYFVSILSTAGNPVTNSVDIYPIYSECTSCVLIVLYDLCAPFCFFLYILNILFTAIHPHVCFTYPSYPRSLWYSATWDLSSVQHSRPRPQLIVPHPCTPSQWLYIGWYYNALKVCRVPPLYTSA